MERGIAILGSDVTFRMAIDGSNAGVRLVRVTDQVASRQAADVFIDGQPAGRWAQPLGNEYSRWLEDAFEIPAELTAGKQSLAVHLVPVDGASPWRASRYETIPYVAAFNDTQAPTTVTGIQAMTVDDTNAIDVRWERANDDAVVAHYEVYASQIPSVPITPTRSSARRRPPASATAGSGSGRPGTTLSERSTVPETWVGSPARPRVRPGTR